jgi:AraC-like DNA-binding protein
VSLIEAALRGGAVVLLVLLVALLLRDARRVPAGVFAALFATGAAAYTIVSASVFAPVPPLSLLPLRMLGMGNPLVFCLFAASLFDDDFKPSRWHALAWLAMVAFGMVACLWIDAAPARWAFSALGLACNALGVWYVLAGRSIDLVEERRRLRAALVVLLAVYSVAVITTEIALPGGSGGPILYLANSIGLLTVTLVFALVLLSVSTDGALVSIPVSAQSVQGIMQGTVQGTIKGAVQTTSPFRPVAVPDQADHVERDDDTRLLVALRRLMEHDRAYREEGLSIGGLAAKIGLPEHGLRRLINRRLGYRNFNAFLNSYRLDDVMAALADPAQEAVPILTIAMDAGFQSLGPFNRAFKARTGTTPSEFRRLQLSRVGRAAAE